VFRQRRGDDEEKMSLNAAGRFGDKFDEIDR
jgi:hypothetical protein